LLFVGRDVTRIKLKTEQIWPGAPPLGSASSSPPFINRSSYFCQASRGPKTHPFLLGRWVPADFERDPVGGFGPRPLRIQKPFESLPGISWAAWKLLRSTFFSQNLVIFLSAFPLFSPLLFSPSLLRPGDGSFLGVSRFIHSLPGPSTHLSLPAFQATISNPLFAFRTRVQVSLVRASGG